MDPKQIIAAIEQQESLSASGKLDDERQSARDRFLGKPYGNEQEGRSQIVMKDVQDTIAWIMPALMKIFASGDEVCVFNPTGPEDVNQAELETEYINFVLMQKNPGFLILHDWFHDALLEKNGYVYALPEIESKVDRAQYEGLTDDEFALLMQNPSNECVEHSEFMDEMGMLRHSCVIQTKADYHCIKVRNVPPERVRVAADWPHINLENCPFVEIIDWPTISELREAGYEVDDNIDDNANSQDEGYEGNRFQNEFQALNREDLEADPATRRVKTRYVWMKYDADEDGLAELNHYVVVGTNILDSRPDDITPVACITPQRMPHEHTGLSVDDAVADLQAIRTTLVRGFLDNMYLANNGRNAIDASRVNLDDMLTSRPGGVVRVSGDPSGAIVPLIHPQVGGDILSAVEYVDGVRENRTGVTRYNQGIDANSLNKTATGINAIQNASMQRIELIARLFAETGVKALMLIVHALSLKHSRQAEMVRLKGQWAQVDPSSWKARADVSVSVGIGTGNKDQQLMHLGNIWQMQLAGLQLGIATPENLYHTAAKMTQNAGFKQAEQFWKNPTEGPPVQQPPPPEVQVEQMKQQSDVQKFQAETQLEQQKLAFEASEKEKDRQLEIAKVQMQEATKIEIAKINAETGAQVEMVREQNRAKPVSQEWDDTGLREAVTGSTQDQIQIMRDLQLTMQALAEAVSRPKMLIRGPDGKATGVQ